MFQQTVYGRYMQYATPILLSVVQAMRCYSVIEKSVVNKLLSPTKFPQVCWRATPTTHSLTTNDTARRTKHKGLQHSLHTYHHMSTAINRFRKVKSEKCVCAATTNKSNHTYICPGGLFACGVYYLFIYYFLWKYRPLDIVPFCEFPRGNLACLSNNE